MIVNARAVAFYLPQFFPIPENDEWWGPGFTEWTNAARARSLFPGHQRPPLPGELGFYDLRLPETRQAQSDLAREYGIEAFAYWHYWFGHGRKILDRPFREVVHSGSPEISFCLAWANQDWSGVWHGASGQILVKQQYPGAVDDMAHFEEVLPAFRDPRYLRVDGRPVFYVYRPEDLPDAAAFVDAWQAMAQRAGLGGLYLVAEVADTAAGLTYTAWSSDGFDACTHVQLPAERTLRALTRLRLIKRLLGGPEVFPYSTTAVTRLIDGPTVHPCVYPNWDNTPRAGRAGVVLTGATPQAFELNVRGAVGRLTDRPQQHRLLWIKSWNEWAEGNHLEPDLKFGRGWLEALRNALL